jgi:hypothetical protein
MLREDFDQLTNIVEQQAAIIRNFEDERQRQTGARKALGIVWAIFTTGIAAIAYTAHDIAGYFSTKH